jgi:hypothetical protein
VRWWLQSAWATGGDSPGTTRAIVLAKPAELRTYTEILGLATTTREGPLLVTTGFEELLGDRSPALPILAHEVGHELIRRRQQTSLVSDGVPLASPLGCARPISPRC